MQYSYKPLQLNISHNQLAIEQRAMATTPYSSFTTAEPQHAQGHQKLDENGEVIIAEAVCNRRSICLHVFCVYWLFSALLLFICLPCALILGCICGRRAAAAWRLYLTPTGIHYTKVGVFCCFYDEIFIPLRDIEQVFVEQVIEIYQNGNVAQGRRVKVKIHRGKIASYVPWCQRTCCLVDTVDLGFIDNACDFFAAIKRQMAANEC